MAGVNYPLHYGRSGLCLTSVCVQGDLKAVIYGQASRGPRDHVLRLERDVLGGFEELWNMWVRARRTMGVLRGVLDEVTGA
jgi:hypothetical protein